MGLFSRVKSIVRGFFGVMTKRAEERNPEYLIADAESRIQKSKKEAEKQLVEIQTWAEMVRLDMRAAENRLLDIRDKLTIATQEKDRNLLIELLIQEEECEALFNERKALFDNAVGEALRVRDHYKHFEAEMNSKLRELQNIKSQTQLVVMREKIIELDNKYGSADGGFGDSELKESMDRLRRSINERSARIIATEQLRSESTEYKIKNIDCKVSWNRAASKADKLIASAPDGFIDSKSVTEIR